MTSRLVFLAVIPALLYGSITGEEQKSTSTLAGSNTTVQGMSPRATAKVAYREPGPQYGRYLVSATGADVQPLLDATIESAGTACTYSRTGDLFFIICLGSTISNHFEARLAALGYTVSLATVSPVLAGTPTLPPGSGSGSVGIVAIPICPWTITTQDSWLSITSGSGVGNGTITVSYGPNTSSSPRTATLRVALPPGVEPVQASSLLLTITQSAGTISICEEGSFGCSQTGSPVALSSQLGAALAPSKTIQIAATLGSQWNFTAKASTNSGGNWLSVSPASGISSTTSGLVTIAANPAGLAVGTYTGTVTISAPGTSNPSIQIPVTFSVTAPTLTVSPSALSFSYQVAGTTPTSQSLTLNSSSAVAFSASATTTSGGNWLSVSPANGTTPSATLSVSVNPAALSPGSYSGSILLAAPSASTPSTQVPVTLTVTGAPITVSKSSLSFVIQAGGVAPTQSVSAASSGGIPYSTSIATTSGGNWLSVSPSSGNLPTSLIVSVNSSGLAAGSYSGTVTIAATEATGPSQIQVSLVVTPATLQISPASLAFTYKTGDPLPSNQTVAVNSLTTAPFQAITVTTSTISGGAWLGVGSTSALTPASVAVSVNPIGLEAGVYKGFINVTGAAAGSVAATVPVSLTITGPPVPAVASVANAASFASGAVAPGEIITIFGSNLGPPTLTIYTLTNGRLDSTLAGTTVTFDGIPAPILYTLASQLSVQVPYGITTPTTKLVVRYGELTSAVTSVPVSPSMPGLFTLDSSGGGPAAAFNQDLTLNSVSNPAPPGSVVVLYATGEGQTNPAGTEGLITSLSPPFPAPVLPVSVKFGGRTANILFAGETPSSLAGLLQINAVVPEGTGSGAVPVIVTVGTRDSQAGVTVNVK